MIGKTVTQSIGSWAIGGRVEQRHASHDQLFGIRGRDGHLYWQWLCDFKVGADLFGPIRVHQI